jgi:hypothetical protein
LICRFFLQQQQIPETPFPRNYRRNRFVRKPYFYQRPSGLYVRFLIPKHVREGTGTRYVIRSLAGLR